jgi:hypothetical protein
MNPEEEIADKEWGEHYGDPDYVEGSHPMDSDNVTWHHVWQKPSPRQVEGEELG